MISRARRVLQLLTEHQDGLTAGVLWEKLQSETLEDVDYDSLRSQISGMKKRGLVYLEPAQNCPCCMMRTNYYRITAQGRIVNNNR